MSRGAAQPRGAEYESAGLALQIGKIVGQIILPREVETHEGRHRLSHWLTRSETQGLLSPVHDAPFLVIGMEGGWQQWQVRPEELDLQSLVDVAEQYRAPRSGGSAGLGHPLQGQVSDR